MSRSIRWAAALACLLGALSVVPVQAAELQIESPRFTYDRDANIYLYEDGRLLLGDLTLFASEMILNATTGVVTATGFVRLETPGLTGLGESLELDVQTRVVRFHNASLYSSEGQAYLRAEDITIHPNGRLELVHCTVSVCPPGVTGRWEVAASSLDIYPDQIAVAWNPRLYLGPVPVLWAPVVAGPAVLERRTGLLAPTLTQTSSGLKRFDLGWRFKVPVFINLGYDHDLTVTPENIQTRGGALELEYNYAFWLGQEGQLTLWGIRERDPRDPLEENDILTEVGKTLPTTELTRYRLDWTHNQALGDHRRLILSYHDTSDGQVRWEYERVSQYRPYRTYQASLTNQWRWGDAALTFEQNADYLAESVYANDESFTDLKLRPQLLPRLSARVGGRLSESVPLAVELGLSGANFEAEEGISGHLYEATPTLTLPLALGGAFELRSTFTRHLVAYRALTQFQPGAPEILLDAESFGQSEGTVELRTAFARVFRTERGRFDALKHRITPRLILHAVEDVPQPFTDQVLRARVAEKLVTLRLDNELLGRGRTAPATNGDRSPATPPPPAPVSRLLSVDLIQRYNLLQRADAPELEGPGFERRQETERGEPLLPLVLEISASGRFYSASARFNYHHQLQRSTQSSIGVDGELNERVRLGVGYGYNEFTFLTPDNKLVPAANGFRFDGEVSFSDTLSTGFEARVNLSDAPPPLDRRLDRGNLFVDYHPVCYSVRMSYSEQVVTVEDDGIENFYVDRQIQFTFSLSGVSGPALQPGSTAGYAPAPGTVAGTASPPRCRG